MFFLDFFKHYSMLQREYAKVKLLENKLELQELRIIEMHHRVKNNLEMILSIVDMQSSGAKDKSKFEELKKRIYAIAQTYNMLSNTADDMLNMQEYITKLVSSIYQSAKQARDVDLLVDVDSDIVFELNRSIYIGLIINELVVNSFKYAFTNQGAKLSISLKKYKLGFELVVEDNGKGFDVKQGIVEDSFGLIIVEKIVLSDLKGKITTLSKNRTKHTIRFYDA